MSTVVEQGGRLRFAPSPPPPPPPIAPPIVESRAAKPAGRWGFAHVPALDGLRGAAVAAVLLYHAGYLDGGYLGVDLFFVLSGFLITSLLLAEHAGTGSIGLIAFWARRVRRLLPAALVLLAGVALYAWLLARPVDRGAIRDEGLATLFYVANWRTILDGTSYWDLSLAPSPLQHTWSLAIEEQFYLLWPLVVAGLARWRRADLTRTVGRVALGLAAASAALFVGLGLLGASDTRVYEGTDTRAVALLLGVGLAARRTGVMRRTTAMEREVVGVGALVALVAMWATLEGESRWLYRGGLPLASGLAVVVIAAACDRRSPLLGRLLAWPPLRGLGLISYGLYLWHWPIYVAVDQHNGRLPLLGDTMLAGLGLLGVKVGLSLVAAMVSYRLVERPIRRGALRGWPGGVGAVVAIVATAAVLVAATADSVAPTPPPRQLRRLPAVDVDGPTVAVVGDSVAQSVVAPMFEDPGRFGIDPVDHSRIGCKLLGERYTMQNSAGIDDHPPACADPLVVARSRPDVVLAYFGARPNDAAKMDGEYVRACDRRYDEAWRVALSDRLVELSDGGRVPVVVATIPPSGRYAQPFEGADERIACVNEVTSEVVASNGDAHLLEIEELLCPERTCIESLGGDPVRSDGVHFDAGEGGARVADWVVERVLDVTGLHRADRSAAAPVIAQGRPPE